MAKKTNKSSNKNLTLYSLKQANKIYDETFTVNIDGYDVSIKKFWSKSLVNALILEFANNIRSINMDERLSATYMYLLLLRYFTSLAIPEDLPKQMEWLNELIDSGYLGQLISNLPDDQMEIVSKELKTATDNMAKNLANIQEELDNQEFKNEEVKQLIPNTTSDKPE